MTEPRSSEVPEDENEDVAVPVYGGAESDVEESSAADVFLAVPDVSEPTGWTTFRVKRRNRDRRGGRIGFRPR